MFNYRKRDIENKAKECNFITNTTEKVLRLLDILEFIHNNEINSFLALKGGTAINLCLLDLERLSVDIDLDFTENCSREQMLEKRKQIDYEIRSFMANEGYALSDRSKFVHTLDSYVYSYRTLSNSNDILKIEINYSDRCHILDIDEAYSSAKLGKTITIRKLSDAELIGSKLSALLGRTTPRDVYDFYNLINSNFIQDYSLVKKIALFYIVISAEKPIVFKDIFSEAVSKIKELNYNKIRETLIPVIHGKTEIDINKMVDIVIGKLNEMFVLSEEEKQYIEFFNNNDFKPDLLFGEYQINDLSNHPMALWKTKIQCDKQIEVSRDKSAKGLS